MRHLCHFLIGFALVFGGGWTTNTWAEETASEGAMCSEHGVLEAVCTKCNPALVPIFKAKGNWCAEHGFPESFCPTCHPEAKGKPSAEVTTGGDGPAEGTLVVFRTKETARLAGLHFATALEKPTAREILATAHIAYDATRVAQINPRMPGVVLAIKADVGVSVKAGAVLAVIESAGVGADQSRLSAAKARVEAADANFKRAEKLRAAGAYSERDLLAAKREKAEASADLRSAQSALKMVGATTGGGHYTLTAPIAGVVTQRTATIGRMVDQEETVFEIVDSSSMWVDLDVPESDISLIALGQVVTLSLDALPDREFKGTLSYIAPAVDARTRTVSVRAALDNEDGALRANLFGRGRIAVTDMRAAVLVPKSAVQRARSVNLVFVRTAEDTFEARRVTVSPASGDLVAVAGRIPAGAEVVTEGSYLLKTETMKESIGAGCCEVK